MTLSADELLSGGRTVHRLAVPTRVLTPGSDGEGDLDRGHGVAKPERDNAEPVGQGSSEMIVVLRPLLLSDLQRIHKAAREDQALTSVLMVQQALVEPSLTIDQVNGMHAGLVEFLLAEVNRISGLSLTGDELAEAVQAPMARACFELSRHFGWTPEQCAELTVGQILLYLEMTGRQPAAASGWGGG